MDRSICDETNITHMRELTEAETAATTGGLSDAVRLIISAIASPAPWTGDPEYSGYGHLIGTCPK
jgi:hypothetical protein